MTVLRVPEALHGAIRTDLQRPHPVAAERVGFLFGRIGNRGGSPEIVLATKYEPVDDAEYIDDPLVAARISGAAIQNAMQLALSEQLCCLHVHMHEHRGTPTWSGVDLREIPRVARSFVGVAPGQAHGALLLSENSATAFVIDRASRNPVKLPKIVIVGSTIRIFTSRGS